MNACEYVCCGCVHVGKSYSCSFVEVSPLTKTIVSKNKSDKLLPMCMCVCVSVGVCVCVCEQL